MARSHRSGTDSVSYLRVSSEGQVKTDYDPEGNSIPAQRAANLLRARDVGSTVVEEFVDPGRTGTSMEKRPEFKAMLAYVREHPNVKYVIVYALSRFARNRYDDAVLMMSLEKLGVTLLSSTERNLDDTPAGKAMHGMIAVFNQYQSDASGADISYKMGQKVVSKGGSLRVAPVGYRNVRDFSEGREIRTIALDPERDRVPLVRECFELYATGDYTVESLTREMAARGLTMHATPTKPERPVQRSYIGRMLRDRFYIGEVKYKGQWYPGRHETFIDRELFERVQRVLDSHSGAGVRKNRLDHYLKGVFRCNRCGSRLIYSLVKNQYEYFYCVGSKRVGCSQSYISAETLERELLNRYHLVRLDEEFRGRVAARVQETLEDEQAAQAATEVRVSKRLKTLDTQENRYLDLLGDPDWPQDKLKAKLAAIRQERSDLATQLAAVKQNLNVGRQVFADALQLLSDPYELYKSLPDPERRLMTLTIFGTLKVDTKEIVSHELRSPFAELVEVQTRHCNPVKGQQSYQRLVGSLDGSWQAVFAQWETEMKQGTLLTEDALPWETLEPADLLELAVYEDSSSYKAGMVDLARSLSNSSPSPLQRAIQAYRRMTLGEPGVNGPSTRPAPRRLLRLSSERVDALVARYEAGATVYELADEFGIARSTVSLRLKGRGVKLRRQSPSQIAVNDMVELYHLGHSLASIGNSLGVHASTVLTHLRRRGVELRDSHGQERY